MALHTQRFFLYVFVNASLCCDASVFAPPPTAFTWIPILPAASYLPDHLLQGKRIEKTCELRQLSRQHCIDIYASMQRWQATPHLSVINAARLATPPMFVIDNWHDRHCFKPVKAFFESINEDYDEVIWLLPLQLYLNCIALRLWCHPRLSIHYIVANL